MTAFLRHYPEYLQLVANGQQKHLPPDYSRDDHNLPTSVWDRPLELQAGKMLHQNGKFAQGTTIDRFITQKCFTVCSMISSLLDKTKNESPTSQLYYLTPKMRTLLHGPDDKSATSPLPPAKRYKIDRNSIIEHLNEAIATDDDNKKNTTLKIIKMLLDNNMIKTSGSAHEQTTILEQVDDESLKDVVMNEFTKEYNKKKRKKQKNDNVDNNSEHHGNEHNMDES